VPLLRPSWPAIMAIAITAGRTKMAAFASS